ncbi:MAG TPA: hypothetical protein VIK47_07910, partial [Kiloniellales bacterium]
GGDNRPEAGQDGGRQDGRPASESQEGQAPAPVANGQDAPPAAQPRPSGHGGRHRRPAPPREAASGNGGQAGNGNPQAQPNPQAENDCEPAGV